MLDRIRDLLTARQLSSTQFADVIGVSRPVVSHILSGRNKPSLEVVQKILTALPDLSVNWLLNGAGPMLTSSLEPTEPPKRRVLATAAPVGPANTAPPVIPSAAGIAEQTKGPIPNTVVEAAPTEPATAATAPLMPPTAAIGPLPIPSPVRPSVTAPVIAALTDAPAAVPAGVALAQSLSEAGKSIRRIVIFYHDGTFADYQPETTR